MKDLTRSRLLLLLFIAIRPCLAFQSSDGSQFAGQIHDQDQDEDEFLFRRSKGNLTCDECVAPHCEPHLHGHEFHDNGDLAPKLCHKAIKCFTAHVRDHDGVEHKHKGCAKDLTSYSFYCKTPDYDGRHTHAQNDGKSAQYAVNCCGENRCNRADIWPELPDVPVIVVGQTAADEGDFAAGGANSESNRKLVLVSLIPVFFLVVFAAVLFFYLRKKHQKRMAEINQMELNSGEPLLRAQPVGDSTLREFNHDQEITSGSGSGMPRMVKRTLAKDIQLETKNPIGKGRYGQVWLGSYKGDYVAVKVFRAYDEESWKREKDIYGITLLRHENILTYIGADLASYNSTTHMWLVTKYHPYGSLYDFLNRPDVSIDSGAAYKLLESTVCGLAHLHNDINAKQGKPGIAHRDIKTKNILVRLDHTCVIADFGLAVTQDKELFIPKHKSRTGTIRYMSPEDLDESIVKKNDFEAFRQADIYSFALVMWEVLWRTVVIAAAGFEDESGLAPGFQLPYHNVVEHDPKVEEMYKVVCVEGSRPAIRAIWQADRVSWEMARLMKECWHSDPKVRLSALNLKKAIKKLKGNLSYTATENV